MYNQSIFDSVFSPILPSDESRVVADSFLRREEVVSQQARDEMISVIESIELLEPSPSELYVNSSDYPLCIQNMPRYIRFNLRCGLTIQCAFHRMVEDIHSQTIAIFDNQDRLATITMEGFIRGERGGSCGNLNMSHPMIVGIVGDSLASGELLPDVTGRHRARYDRGLRTPTTERFMFDREERSRSFQEHIAREQARFQSDIREEEDGTENGEGDSE